MLFWQNVEKGADAQVKISIVPHFKTVSQNGEKWNKLTLIPETASSYFWITRENLEWKTGSPKCSKKITPRKVMQPYKCYFVFNLPLVKIILFLRFPHSLALLFIDARSTWLFRSYSQPKIAIHAITTVISHTCHRSYHITTHPYTYLPWPPHIFVLHLA